MVIRFWSGQVNLAASLTGFKVNVALYMQKINVAFLLM